MARDLICLNGLMEQGYLGPAASVGAGLWEKSVTLIYILQDPVQRSQEFAEHVAMTRLPWSIREMVTDIARVVVKTGEVTDKVRFERVYRQYSALCFLKHPNPQAIAHLGRASMEANRLPLGAPDLYADSEGYGTMIYQFSVGIFSNAILAFADKYCKNEFDIHCAHFDREAGGILASCIRSGKLRVPPHVATAPDEIPSEFLDFLRESEQDPEWRP
jgi:hypothetical protein